MPGQQGGCSWRKQTRERERENHQVGGAKPRDPNQQRDLGGEGAIRVRVTEGFGLGLGLGLGL